MQYQWVFVCALVAVLASSALGLKCYECSDKEADNACGKMGEEFKKTDDIKVVDCPEPSKNESGRAVCGKTITQYQSLSDTENKGTIANRFCDIVEYEDQCWYKDGAKTSTNICVCSNEDKCNAAVTTSVVSLATLAAAVLAGAML